MSEHLEYITQDGDRWDLIAFDHYGDAMLTKPLFSANPSIVGASPAPLVFKSGIVVRVPILPETEVAAAQLPIWKRS